MKIKGKATKSLIAASILASSIYLSGCNLVNKNEDIHNTTVLNDIMYEEVIDNSADLCIVSTDFKKFKSEKIYTLFSGTQLYDFAVQSFYLSPDVLNKQTITVKGIGTNGKFTLIELPNGEQKYVNSSDIIEAINMDGGNLYHHGHNDDYTVNKDAYVYNRDGVCIGFIGKGTRCLEIAFSDNYSFVITENDEYFYINHNDITLTDEYTKSIFKPKKLEKSPASLDYGNIWFKDGQYHSNTTIYRVYLDDEEMIENTSKQYYTLLKEQPIYYNDGKLESISYDYGILVRIIKENTNYALVELPDGTTGYINKTALTGCLTLNQNEFTPIIKNRNHITNDWVAFYDATGAYQYYVEPSTECTTISSNGIYTFVELKDGSKGYFESSKLIESKNQVSKYVYLKDNAKLYFRNGEGQLVASSTNAKGSVTYLFFIEGDYAYIGDYYCRENYFVKLTDIDESYNIKEVNSYCYVTRDQQMNANLNQNGENYNIDDYELLWIYYNLGEYSYIQKAETLEYGYIKTSELNYLAGDFIYIDLDKQQISCLDDNDGGRYTSKEWGTRSGRDSSPSHEGAFDIDWKAKDWEFTTYRGSYANYWIAYNEYGEGVHDLIGDDEQNYGNESYHQFGSHGCVRVPVEASKYIFENYPIGSMVLVQKK